MAGHCAPLFSKLGTIFVPPRRGHGATFWDNKLNTVACQRRVRNPEQCCFQCTSENLFTSQSLEFVLT